MAGLLFGLLALLAPGAAHAADCPEDPVDPEAWRKRVQALKEPVAFADPEAGAELMELEKQLHGCLAGPPRQQDLVALFTAYGAWVVLTGGEETGARRYLGWAHAIGGDGSYDSDYGPDVGRIYAEQLPLGESTLVLALDPLPLNTLVDGVTVYDEEIPVRPGWHLVQWSDHEGWHAKVVLLDPGDRERIENEVEQRSAPVQPLAPPEPDAPAVPIVRLSCSAQYQLASARVTAEDHVFEGQLGGPAFQLHASVGRLVRGVATVDAGPMGTSILPAVTGSARAGLGLGGDGERVQWEIGVGGGLWLTPSVHGEEGEAPVLVQGAQPGLSGQGAIFLGQGGRIGLRAHGAWLLGSWLAGGSLEGSLATGPVRPTVVFMGEQLTLLGLGEEPDGLLRVGAGLGIGWVY